MISDELLLLLKADAVKFPVSAFFSWL